MALMTTATVKWMTEIYAWIHASRAVLETAVGAGDAVVIVISTAEVPTADACAFASKTSRNVLRGA